MFNDLFNTLIDPEGLTIEVIYNTIFEVVATWITYKILFKPMIIKEVKKELQKNDNND